jgi:hypothetical protein
MVDVQRRGVQQLRGGRPFGRAGRLGDIACHRQTVAVLYQHMAAVAEPLSRRHLARNQSMSIRPIDRTPFRAPQKYFPE